ncbi:MAG TPA: nucleoside triphosphate pyrophosphohydrolase [Gemmatimonadaceae bacterium]|nr:nucleoside triphosphate pyrophosphohydrolase [Gemmatimonadaceae bacterium]
MKPSLEDTLALMRDLRRRCEWDAVQTHESLRPYLIEEAYEVDEALQAGDDARLREELGDLWLQILFHAVIAEERGAFALQDVADGFITKMKARHPHLYGDGVREPWEKMKARKRESILEGLPHGLPTLHRAFRLQDRAAGVGFDWPNTEGPLEKVREELNEVEEELAESAPDQERIQEEIGDLLFAVVNLARKAGVHPALALDRANAKFSGRFAAIEKLAAERGIKVSDAGLAVLDALWDEVKNSDR